jgi:hypothetical protein
LILGLYGDENQADIGEPNIGEPQPNSAEYLPADHVTLAGAGWEEGRIR